MIEFVKRIWKWYMLYFEKLGANHRMVILMLTLVMGIFLYICVRRKRLTFPKAVAIEVLFYYLLFVLMSTVFARKSIGVFRLNVDIINTYRNKIMYNRDTCFELFLNVLLLLPYGVLFPCVIKTRKMVNTFLSGFLLSILIEGLQLVLKKGTFELTDIINNNLGVLLGYILYLVVRKGKQIITIKCKRKGR